MIKAGKNPCPCVVRMLRVGDRKIKYIMYYIVISTEEKIKAWDKHKKCVWGGGQVGVICNIKYRAWVSLL